MLINRHCILEDVLKYWNNNNPSTIGLGRLKRNNETFLISKTYGREDLILINHTDGNQYCYYPYGWNNSNTPKEVKEQGYKEICNNMEQFLRSIHFINWFNQQSIVDMPFNDVVTLLQQGLNSFNYEEALSLFVIN